MKNVGSITIGNMKYFVRNTYDQIFFIMNSVRWLNKDDMFTKYTNIHHAPCLAPSNDLFWQFRRKAKTDRFSLNDFNGWYTQAFMQEIESNPEALNLLETLRVLTLEHGKKVLLICACSDERKCHRILIGKLLMSKGVNVISETPLDVI